jgi:hypothetical protein
LAILAEAVEASVMSVQTLPRYEPVTAASLDERQTSKSQFASALSCKRDSECLILTSLSSEQRGGERAVVARSLSSGAAVGFTVGLVVGGTLGRVFMRLLTLAREDAVGFQTAMGAIVGEFTGPGTTAIYVFGAFAGIVLGVAYAAGRTLLPSGTTLRTIVFTLGSTAFMLGQMTRGNREDFSFLPVTLSLSLIVGSVALTAMPVPLLVERLAPDRDRRPGRLKQGIAALGMTGFAAFAVTGIVIAYNA